MPTEPTSDPIVDFAHLDRLSAHPARLRVLIHSFLTTTPDILNNLEQSLRDRNDEQARNLLHSLAGSALTMGAVAFGNICTQWSRSEDAPFAMSTSIEPLAEPFHQARVILQRCLKDLPADEHETANAAGNPAFTLLLVEDNTTTRLMLKAMLADRYRILEAADGQQALQQAAHGSPDLAIVDLNLGASTADSPSGFRLLQKLSDRMPTLVYTIDQRPQSFQRAVACGAWGYLPKSTSALEYLPAMIDIAVARYQELHGRKAEPKALDIATGWLMATYRLDPHAAHQVMLHLATEKRCTAVEIAQDLLDSHQFHSDLGRFIAEHVRPSEKR